MRTYTIDGKKYEFDCTRFEHCFGERLRSDNKNLPGKSAGKEKTKTALQLEIANAVNASDEAVKNWRRTGKGKTSPDDTDTVHKLEDFFNVERGYLLKPVMTEKENAHMNTTHTAREIDSRELEAAKSLYISILDAIDAHNVRYSDFIEGMSASASGTMFIPNPYLGMSGERYELILAIRKTAMDLPESVRLSAMELVHEIYGPCDESVDSFYETEDFHAYVSTDEYRAHLEKWKAGGASGMAIECLKYTDYNDYKTDEFYRRLDEIFADYIKR